MLSITSSQLHVYHACIFVFARAHICARIYHRSCLDEPREEEKLFCIAATLMLSESRIARNSKISANYSMLRSWTVSKSTVSQISEIIMRIYGDIVMKMMVNCFYKRMNNVPWLLLSSHYIHVILLEILRHEIWYWHLAATSRTSLISETEGDG